MLVCRTIRRSFSPNRGNRMESNHAELRKLSASSRRRFLEQSLLGGLVAVAPPLGAEIVGSIGRSAVDSPEVAMFELEETTIAELQEGMKAGRYTARGIAEKYLERIEALDKHGPAVNSVIEVNPDALALAEASDTERKQKGARGPLHGIPVLIKGNIDTADKMMDTAGLLAVGGSEPPKDSTGGQKPRRAGWVVLRQTHL